jgi:chromate transporter
MISIALLVMRAGVAAVIFDVVINLTVNVFKTRNKLNIMLLFVTFIAGTFYGVSAITIIVICIGFALLTVFVKTKKGVEVN